ncbi:MAG: hypothetical protein J6X37_02175 [Treponema sp.]|uniref:hypothetical protein n=1 Tax=Treponema sp. TaxID=166 RepID=UPI001B649BCF|nr:hypothetical protein [Treponema sp.]MBP5587516.1 hypothetical protein [Treponema sp.]MBR0155285.1 hypothetical protein [Treponema sp.]MCR5386541.1 hypothetical protein [Treponema sp.]
MAEKSKVKFFRTTLAIGFMCILIGLSLILILPAKNTEGFLFIFFFVLMCLAAFLTYASLVLLKPVLLYSGMNLFIYSVAAEIFTTKLIPVHMSKIWPLFMIVFGITLIPSGYLRFKKIRTVYLIPAIVLVFLGTVFSLFSFHIIKVSFRRFIAFVWPAILIAGGLFLIVYYLYSQKYEESFIQDSDDQDEQEDGED